MTRFTKPVTSVHQQVAVLQKRGMIITQDDDAERWLRTVNYYRLSAYWLPMEEPPGSGQQRSRSFVEGTTFSAATDLYVLDRRLRLLVMEAIDRIEIAVRTQWTLKMTGAFGSHPHCNNTLFKNQKFYSEAIQDLRNEVSRSGELFIKHYTDKYDDPPLPPLWMATELMSFGALSKWIDNTIATAQIKLVARAVGLPSADTLTTTLQVLVIVRNHCAHHGRLWNRRLVKRLPLIKSYLEDLRVQGNNQTDNRIYNCLVLLIHLLEHQSPETSFRSRLRALLNGFTSEQLISMGFPCDWKSRVIGT